MKVAATIVVLTLLSASSAKAGTPMTGVELLKICEGSPSQKAACETYLRGVSDTLDFVGGAVPSSGIMEKCVPEGVTAAKLRLVMTKMLHRKDIHKTAPAASLSAVGGRIAVQRCTTPAGTASSDCSTPSQASIVARACGACG